VTTGTGVLATEADSFARDWQAVRADPDIQFAPVTLPPPEPVPDWLRQLGEWLSWVFSPLAELLGAGGPAIPWILGAIAAIVALVVLWRLREPILQLFGRKAPPFVEEPWQPDTAAALALLEEADRLAAEGRFDEATHLLLQRSVGEIAASRPRLLDPSSTAREIAALPALSERARAAFGIIAARVERSLFALRPLSAVDWQAARTAYADFAVAVPQAAAA